MLRTSTRRRIVAAVLASGLLVSGCQIERDRDTEACIDRLIEEEDYEVAEAQAECMGSDDDATETP